MCLLLSIIVDQAGFAYSIWDSTTPYSISRFLLLGHPILRITVMPCLLSSFLLYVSGVHRIPIYQPKSDQSIEFPFSEWYHQPVLRTACSRHLRIAVWSGSVNKSIASYHPTINSRVSLALNIRSLVRQEQGHPRMHPSMKFRWRTSSYKIFHRVTPRTNPCGTLACTFIVRVLFNLILLWLK